MTTTTLRRILHVASGACLLIVPATSWHSFRVFVLATAVVAVCVEITRLRVPRVGDWLGRVVPVFRSAEAQQPSGAMWLAVGYAIAALFSSPAPMAGILVSACADPTASWVGETGGSTGTKTWRGSTAHFVAAVAVLLLGGFSWTGSIVAAVIGTALERWPGPFNDNLVVAPAVALSVSLLA